MVKNFFVLIGHKKSSIFLLIFIVLSVSVYATGVSDSNYVVTTIPFPDDGENPIEIKADSNSFKNESGAGNNISEKSVWNNSSSLLNPIVESDVKKTANKAVKSNNTSGKGAVTVEGADRKEYNRLPFYYYYNPKIKCALRIGCFYEKIKIKSYELIYLHKGFNIKCDLYYLPFVNSSGFGKGFLTVIALDVRLPAEYEREYKGVKRIDRNFEKGTYINFTPELGIGYDIRIGRKFAVRGQVFLAYDTMRTVSLKNETQRAEIIAMGLDIAARYYFKERYSLSMGVSYKRGLNTKIKDAKYEADAEELSFRIGLDYDF